MSNLGLDSTFGILVHFLTRGKLKIRLGIVRGRFPGFVQGETRGQVRHVLHLQLENERPNLNLVAGLQAAFAANQHAINQGPVAAAKVAQEYCVVGDAQQTMLAADHVAVGTDVALGTATKVVFAAWKNEPLAGWPSLDYLQFRGHCVHQAPRPVCRSRQIAAGLTKQGWQTLGKFSSLTCLLCDVFSRHATGSCRMEQVGCMNEFTRFVPELQAESLRNW
jgi:hypothetical protein